MVQQIADKATLDGRDTVAGTYENFDDLWAERTARCGGLEDAFRVLHWRGQRYQPFAEWRRDALAAYREIAGAELCPRFDVPFYNEAGDYAHPLSGQALDVVGIKDGFTLYAPEVETRWSLPPNAVLVKDRALGVGMFAAEVWALAGSPVYLYINDGGLFHIKPYGVSGWCRSISWKHVMEYLTPI